MVVVLFAGVKGSGKTFILKRLCSHQDQLDLSQACIPTVGVSHYQLQLPVSGAHKRSVELRELGGALAQNWTAYLRPQDRLLVFVVDPGDVSVVPEIAVHLLRCVEALSSRADDSNKASLLLLYSKSDLSEQEEQLRLKDRIRLLLRLPELLEFYERSVEFEELSCSVWKDEGFPAIKDWICRKCCSI